MGRRRILTDEQWAEVERRRALARAHCDKRIAVDLGLPVLAMQNAVRHYRSVQSKTQRQGKP